MTKRWIVQLMVGLILGTTVLAATVKLQWDPKPIAETWTLVRIYERTGTAPNYVYTKVAEVPGDQVLATIPNVTPGPHVYVARAYNGTWESLDSNAVSTPTTPGAPVLKIVITVEVP